MKKIIARITEEETQRQISLSALQATYKTLLRLERYDLNKEELHEKLLQCETDINRFWEELTQKYNFPIHIDKSMIIDVENNYIYLNEE